MAANIVFMLWLGGSIALIGWVMVRFASRGVATEIAYKGNKT
jgi:hypothetical protein